jgi:hypothetical protein
VVVKVVLLSVAGSGAGGDDFGSNLLSEEVFRGEQFSLSFCSLSSKKFFTHGWDLTVQCTNLHYLLMILYLQFQFVVYIRHL